MILLFKARRKELPADLLKIQSGKFEKRIMSGLKAFHQDHLRTSQVARRSKLFL